MALTDWTFPGGLIGLNNNVRSFTILTQNGTRPDISKLDGGAEIVYDAFDANGYSHLYVMNPSGTVLRTLTDATVNPALASLVTQRTTGNGRFSPSDDYIVYIAESEQHSADSTPANAGIGIYCNLWACLRNGTQHWKLTNLPIPVTFSAGAVANLGAVNPRFSEDGKYLIWTEHYGDDSRTLGWGTWRIKWAQWDTSLGYPRLINPRTLYMPTLVSTTDPYSGLTTLQNSYVTAMAMYGNPSTKLLMAQNALAVCAYGMDLCTLDLASGTVTNITNDARYWTEMGCVSPYPNIGTAARNFVYMSNEIMAPATYAASAGGTGSTGAALDNSNPDWPHQPKQREWFYRRINDGGGKTQLTSFNDYTAPEYIGRRAFPTNGAMAPDGLSFVGTLGIDFGSGAAYDGTTHLASNVWPNVIGSLKLVRLTFATAI